MKYRIRNTKSRELERCAGYALRSDGLIVDDSGTVCSDLESEMEVADGVYVGDYLLTDIFGSQHALEIKSSFEAVEVRTGMSLEVNLCQKEHYEVIKCR